MNAKNLVSVITPIYNSEHFLENTIQSILKQTHENLELILIDDCSTDDSFKIAKKYLSEDSRITLISLTGNGGAAVARNAGIKIANGRYIAFCDSDDIWMPGKLEAQLLALANSKSAICHTSYLKMKENGELTQSLIKAKEKVTYSDILRSNHIGCSTAIYDVSICGKRLMPDVRKRQDYGLWIDILKDGHESIGLSEPYVYYRIRNVSVSSNKLSAASHHWAALRDFTEISLLRRSFYFIQYATLGLLKKLK